MFSGGDLPCVSTTTSGTSINKNSLVHTSQRAYNHFHYK